MTTIKNIASTSIKDTAVQSLRTDRITALYLGCKTNDLPNLTKPIWVPIYRMSWDDEGNFYYSYTKGFERHHEQLKGHIINPDGGFNRLWKTKHLDTRFSTRIPRRAEEMKIYDLLGVGDVKGDYIAYLARSGGRRFGDNYDIFPEVQCNENGFYSFNFLIVGLGNKVKHNHDQVKLIADTIEAVEPLELKIESEHSYIFCRGVELGYCPEYIHHLIKSDSYCQHQIEIERVNPESETYGGRIVVNLQLKFDFAPWQQSEFQPINPMPV